MTHVLTVVSTKLTTTHNNEHTEKMYKNVQNTTNWMLYYYCDIYYSITEHYTVCRHPYSFYLLIPGATLCAKNNMQKNLNCLSHLSSGSCMSNEHTVLYYVHIQDSIWWMIEVDLHFWPSWVTNHLGLRSITEIILKKQQQNRKYCRLKGKNPRHCKFQPPYVQFCM